MSEAEMMREWEEERELPEDTWTIDDDSKAAWAVKKIAENEAQRDREIEWHKQQIEKAKLRCESDNAWLAMKLEDYSRNLPMRESKTQWSFTVPGGKLIRQKAKQALTVVDEQAAIEALQAQGMTEYIKVKLSLAWAELKKALTETGEVIDGVELREVPEQFVVRPDKGAV